MRKSILATVLFVILNLTNTEIYGQMDTSNVKWEEPKFIVPDEKHWIEDGDGIVCVSYYSATNEFKYGPHATRIKRKKWKVMWGIDTTIYNDYYYGRFKKKAATQFVRDNFQCDYEYADKTRSGLVWTVKIYSESGELLEVHKRVLIGYYSKAFNPPHKCKRNHNNN